MTDPFGRTGPTELPDRDLMLVERIRPLGPFEDWRARPAPQLGLPEWVWARRVSPEREDHDLLVTRLTEASKASEMVSHHLVVQTLGTLETASGTLVQLSEDLDAIDLDRCPVAESPLPIATAVWIAQQLLEALAHAHTFEMVHGCVYPTAVWLRRNGAVMLDYGLSATPASDEGAMTTDLDIRFVHPVWAGEGLGLPKEDVYGVMAILWWLVTGRPYRTSAGAIVHRPARSLRPEVPPALDEAFEIGLGLRGEGLVARSLADRLSRVFYAELRGEPSRDGPKAVSRWIEGHLRRTTSDLDDSVSLLAVESLQGRFTRAVRLREAPVAPKDLTEGDLEMVDPSQHGPIVDGPEPTVEVFEAPTVMARDHRGAERIVTILPGAPDPTHTPLVTNVRTQASAASLVRPVRSSEAETAEEMVPGEHKPTVTVPWEMALSHDPATAFEVERTVTNESDPRISSRPSRATQVLLYSSKAGFFLLGFVATWLLLTMIRTL